MWKGHSRGNVASNCKTSEKSQNIGLWVDLSKYIAPLANEGNIMSFQDDLSGGSLNKNQPNLISKLLPLKTTINIPMIISYITKFQCLKFGFWVVTSTLQTSIQLDLSKKYVDLQLWSLNLRSHAFSGQIWGKLDVAS